MIVVALIALGVGLVSLALRDGASTRLHTEAQRLGALLDAARAESRASGLAVSWRLAALDDDADFRFVRRWSCPRAGSTRGCGPTSAARVRCCSGPSR